jgi:hypothetical protein
MYSGMEGKGAEDGDRREENEYLLGDAPVRVCWRRERDDTCDDGGGDDGCGSSGRFGDSNERAVGMVARTTAAVPGMAAATARRAATTVMAPLTSSCAAVVKRPRDEMLLLV